MCVSLWANEIKETLVEIIVGQCASLVCKEERSRLAKISVPVQEWMDEAKVSACNYGRLVARLQTARSHMLALKKSKAF